MNGTEQTAPQKRLYKSRTNRMIDGVCGGIAEYFDIDPTIIRIVWVLITLLGGSGFIFYIVAMIVMPVNPQHVSGAPVQAGGSSQTGDKRRFWGILLILIGAFILMINVGWIAEFHWWSFSRKFLLPTLLILLGLVLIYVRGRVGRSHRTAAEMGATGGTKPVQRELRRSVTNRKLFGVCGGVATYFDIDPTIIRILSIVLVLASFGWALLLYIILAILMPEEQPTANS